MFERKDDVILSPDELRGIEAVELNKNRLISWGRVKQDVSRVEKASNRVFRSMGLEPPAPAGAVDKNSFSLNLPGPGRAGLYSLLISLGMGATEVMVFGLRTAIFVAGKLVLWAGGLFLIMIALRYLEAL